MREEVPRPTVLHLVNSFNEGGTERQAVRLANALHDTGRWRVSVATLNPSGPLREALVSDVRDAARTYRLDGFVSVTALHQLRALVGHLRSDGVAIVHAHGFYPNVFGMAAGYLAGVPVRIASKRESVQLRRPLPASLERLAFTLATRLVANCASVRDELVSWGISADRISVIHNALDASHAPARNISLAARADPPRHRVVHLANFHHDAKDHATLLRAAQRVIATRPTVDFILAGEGPGAAGAHALARELGLQGHVHLIGHCDDVGALLASADVGVLSSRHEGFPNAVLEYMAAALPVVTTDAGGVREAVEDGVMGRVVPPGDDEALARALLELLGNAALRGRMGAAGCAHVMKVFSIDQLVHRTTTLYTNELDRVRAHSR
jgi:glycosyltransferase involved in cell wall biosynthesis